METVQEMVTIPEGFCHMPPKFSREEVISYLTTKRDRYRQWRDQAVARKDWALATRFRQGYLMLETIIADINDMQQE
jgi:hypothetical protein